MLLCALLLLSVALCCKAQAQGSGSGRALTRSSPWMVMDEMDCQAGESFGSYDTLKAAQAACIKLGEVKCGDMYVYNRNCDGTGGFSLCKRFKYTSGSPSCVIFLTGTGPDNTTPEPFKLTGMPSNGISYDTDCSPTAVYPTLKAAQAACTALGSKSCGGVLDQGCDGWGGFFTCKPGHYSESLAGWNSCVHLLNPASAVGGSDDTTTAPDASTTVNPCSYALNATACNAEACSGYIWHRSHCVQGFRTSGGGVGLLVALLVIVILVGIGAVVFLVIAKLRRKGYSSEPDNFLVIGEPV